MRYAPLTTNAIEHRNTEKRKQLIPFKMAMNYNLDKAVCTKHTAAESEYMTQAFFTLTE